MTSSKPRRPAFQDRLPTFGRTCFGCGQENDHGLRIRSHWEGEEGVCDWTPEPHHQAGQGFLCGGIIATLIDCHSASTAVAHAYRAEGREIGDKPEVNIVTASLQVDYLKPTPMDTPLQLRARITSLDGRRITATCSLLAGGVETARGNTVFARIRRT